MANAAGIPKAMVVSPEFRGVNKFVSDSKLVSSSVSKMVTSVNRSLGRLKTSTASLSATSQAIQKVNRSVSASLGSINKWASGFDATNNVLTRFGSSLASAGQRITQLSSQMERVGRGMTMFLTVPIALFGTAAIKAGLDFEKAMLKVQNLVGSTTEQMSAYRDMILSTNVALGATPVELAEGLFAAASGFGGGGDLAKASQVMEVLEASTKGAVVGLGEMEDVARVTTALLNSFGDEGLTASQAVSSLVVAVQEGNFEVDRLATSLGNVLGTATNVGAGVSDVLAFVSAYTKFGAAPATAVTALNTALTNLIKPGEKNREVLEAYGLTLQGVREQIQGPNGLAGLLINMRNTMSEQEFIGIFGRRSLRAILALTDGVKQGEDVIEGFAATYAETQQKIRKESDITQETIAANAQAMEQAFDETGGAIGQVAQISALEDAFLRITDTLTFKLQQVRSGIQGIFVGISEALNVPLKILADLLIENLSVITDWIRANQESVVVIAALATGLAALGPALIIFAKIGQSIGFFVGILGTFVNVIGLAIGGVINLGVQLGVLAINIATRTIQAFVGLTVTIIQTALAVASLTAQFIVFTAAQFGTKITGIALGFVSILTSIGPIVIGIGLIATAVLAAIGAFSALYDGLVGVVNTIREAFVGPAEQARGWGTNLMNEFNKGIVEGFTELVRILNQIGQILANWLKPGSPPRIAPEIDKWGTATMQEWIDGWLKADFGVFNTIQDMVETFLSSMAASVGDEDSEGAIAKVLLGSREAIAFAINQMKEFGQVSQKALNDIYTAIGTTTLELENYISAVLSAAATTDQLAAAQEKVNEINKRYARQLDPIQKQLAAIDAQRQGIADDREIEKLEKLLQRGNLPEQVRKLAQLRIREIGLQQQAAGVEADRDAELSVAERQIEIATEANEAAQRQLEFAEEALGLQTKGLDQMAAMIKSVNAIAATVAKIPPKLDELIAGGALSDLDLPELTGGSGLGGLFDIDPNEEIEGATNKLLLLKDELVLLGETWGTVWTNATLAVQTWWTDIKAVYLDYKTEFLDKFGPTLTALKEEGSLIWGDLTKIIQDFWKDVKPDLEDFIEGMGDVGDSMLNDAPPAIRAFGGAVREYLLPALDRVADYVGQDIFARLIAPIALAPLGFVALLPEILNQVRTFTDQYTGSLQGISDGITTWLNSTAETIQETFGTLFSSDGEPVTNQEILDMIGIKETNMNEAAATFIKWFSDEANRLADEAITEVGEEVTGFFETMDTVVGTAFEGMSETIGTLYTTTEEGSGVFDALRTKLDLLTGAGGVGGFSGLGLAIGLNRTTFELLRLKYEEMRLKAIELKDTALETVRLKLEELDVAIGIALGWWETFRLKIEDVITWVLDLAARMETELLNALTVIQTFIDENLNKALEAWRLLVEKIHDFIKDKFEGVIDDITNTLGNLLGAIDALLQPLRTLIGLLKEAYEWWQKVSSFGSAPSPGGGGSAGAGGGTDDAGATATGGGAGGAGIAAVGTAPVPSFSPMQGNALPRSIASSAARAIGTTVSSASTFSGSTRGRSGGASPSPTVVGSPGSMIASEGATLIQFGDVTINNDMDMAVFEARVRTAVSQSMKG